MNLDNIQTAFNKLQEMWEEDCKINSVELDTASINIPQLHSKYMKFLSDFCITRKKLELRMKTLKREKFEYYTKKAPPEVYREKPFNLTLLKSEVKDYIESDEDVCEHQLKIDLIDVTINYLESVIKQIGNRTYQIKNSIEYQKFINGLN